MFYAVEVLAKKGQLAAPWIAAHGDKRLSKQDIVHVSIAETIAAIQSGKVPELALRTSSHIVLGLARIFLRQVRLLHGECSALLASIGASAKESTQAKVKLVVDPAKITLPVRLADCLGGMTASEPTSQRWSLSGVELPRMSLGDSTINYSMSLNDISLNEAVTFLSKESELHKTDTSDGIILQHLSTTLNTLDPIEIAESVEPLAVELTQGSLTKRSLIEDELAVKKPKTAVVDRYISFSSHLLKLSQHIVQTYQGPTSSTSRPGLLLPPAVEQFFGAQIALEVHQAHLDDFANSSIEVPRGAVATERANRLSLPFPADLPGSVLNSTAGLRQSVIGVDGGVGVDPELDDSVLIEPAENSAILEDWPSFTRLSPREKAVSFRSLLNSITVGQVSACQASPFASITVRPVTVQ